MTWIWNALVKLCYWSKCDESKLKNKFLTQQYLYEIYVINVRRSLGNLKGIFQVYPKFYVTMIQHHYGRIFDEQLNMKYFNLVG